MRPSRPDSVRCTRRGKNDVPLTFEHLGDHGLLTTSECRRPYPAQFLRRHRLNTAEIVMSV